MENISLSVGRNTERLSHCADDAPAATAAVAVALVNKIGTTPHMNGSTPSNVTTTTPNAGGGVGSSGGVVIVGNNNNNNNSNNLNSSNTTTTTTSNNNTNTNINNNNSSTGGGGGGGGNNGNNVIRTTSIRRPQQQSHFLSSDQKLLTLTIHKDSNGYGMKVSGDNPVYVESVKIGGAAQKAGLVAGDMILKVNGVEVRSEKHPTVVALIKSHLVVELTVLKSPKMQQRPSSIGLGPGTPILTRDRTASITGPQPVDNDKRRELEFHKIQTLQLMLEQEKKNLENLKTSYNSVNNRQDRARAEANIRQLQEQLRQVGGEDAKNTLHFLTTTSPNLPTTLITPPSGGGLQQQQQLQQQHHHHHHHVTTPQNTSSSSSPAFLSRFPRSLSSLSLGTRKQKEKDLLIASPNNFIKFSPSTDLISTQNNAKNSPTSSIPATQSIFQKYQQQKQQQQQLPPPQYNPPIIAASKKKFTSNDIPPPLPQRNPPRPNLDFGNIDWRNRNQPPPTSDLDLTMAQSPKRNSPSNSTNLLNNNLVGNSGGGKLSSSSSSTSSSSANKKRSKVKTKALSDPKMSTQLFLQMEKGEANSQVDMSIPPPLPPRQPGMMEENKLSGRPIPNSVETLMNYPLVSTCTAVRDNLMSGGGGGGAQQQHPSRQQYHHHHHQQQQHPIKQNSSMKAIALGQTPQNHFSNKHRRVVSSPDNLHARQLDRSNKSPTGSWELLEKDNEITPPGTPPPPYPSSQNQMTQSLHSSSQLTSQNSEETDHAFMDNNGSGGAIGGNNFINVPVTYPNQIIAAQVNTTQKKIISMEDEEVSDQECIIDEHGPFNYFQRLLEQENIAHLAVFLNYVLSNSDPAPLLFYLITGLYKEGTVKDMRKWAYEIHSTFLVPCAPLMWFVTDESLAREVDNVLQNEYDKVEILRKVFWKSRKKAKERICEQLIDFQQKRTAGLGTIYGPCDLTLADARGDKNKEQKIFEETLLKKLQSIVDEIDREAPIEDPRKSALCSALSTVLLRIFITRSNPGSPIDRVHHFVSREKSFKRIMGKHRKIVVRGHPLTLRQYYEVTHCNHCQLIIWGVSPQGYHCTDCKLNIHRLCSKVLEESCPGPVLQKRKEQNSDNKISKLMGKIRPSHNFIQNERRIESSMAEDIFNSDRLNSTSVVRQPSDRRPDLVNSSINSSISGGGGGASGGNGSIGGSSATTSSHNTNEFYTSQSLDADSNALDAEQDSKTKDNRSKSKSAPVSVNRSESYKDRLTQKRLRSSRRKTSDPSLTKTNDEQQSELGLSNANYTASSSSSLSSGGSLGSPSTSLEQVGTPITGYNQHHHGHHGHHHHHHHGHQGGHHHQQHHNHQQQHQQQQQSHHGTPLQTSTATSGRLWVDSDDEDIFNEVDWSSNVSAELLIALTDVEKKRQEIINEIFQTERSHVRTLRVLEGIFFLPLRESGALPVDHLQLLFPPALLSLKDLHFSFEQQLKQRRIEHNYIVENVGDLLIEMFEGQSGEKLCEYAMQFCTRQQIALEGLKEKRRKDENLQRFLTKAESHKACRRLQLKDLLPTVLQRLTKYPLLFENLYKITQRVNPDNQLEAEAIKRALDSSKRILVEVNQAVKSAEDTHKLQTIQRKLDKSGFDKESNEFKNLDLTQYKLIHDGQLTLKKNPGVQLHGLLFENMMVLVQKQDDKYFLKYFPNLAAGTTESNKLISPITHFDQQTLVRQSAVDKNTFFLILTKASQMLELRAPSSSECKAWFKHISDAAEQYKPRSKNNQEIVDDPASTTLPHSNTKESLEGTPERCTATTVTSSISSGGSTSINNLTGREQQQQQQQLSQDKFNKQQNNLINNNSTTTATSTTSTTSSDKLINQTSGNRITDDQIDRKRIQSVSDGSNDQIKQQQQQQQQLQLQQQNSQSDRRDSIYSNNSNNTRTLMQHCPLLEPSEIQISISPAHTAEPIVTPTEQLRRLDDKIRSGLAEKQKIICDMFRVPNEHFMAIVDIVGQPEAPKDSSDICLAAFAQVQSLTEVLSEYMKCSAEQEISAVSTAVCDKCHEENIRQQQQILHINERRNSFTTTTPTASTVTTAAAIAAVTTATAIGVSNNSLRSMSPLPSSIASTATTTTTGATILPQSANDTATVVDNGNDVTNNNTNKKDISISSISKDFEILDVNEDDDGYCEIDELRLPSVQTANKTNNNNNNNGQLTSTTTTAAATPELIKRQSTISADSIPEESEQDITQDDELTNTSTSLSNSSNANSNSKGKIDGDVGRNKNDADDDDENNRNSNADEQQQQKKISEDDSTYSEHIEINENFDATTTASLNKITFSGNLVCHESSNCSSSSNNPFNEMMNSCIEPNRLAHVNSLEPTVPCSLISGFVTALNEQISLLLPKINERDLERERLRKENQHLRELLNAMHERRRVNDEKETPEKVLKNDENRTPETPEKVLKNNENRTPETPEKVLKNDENAFE